MTLFWLLCMALVLGGLLASLASQIPWRTLRIQGTRTVQALAPARQVAARLLVSGLRGRVLSPSDTGSRAGPPGPFGGVPGEQFGRFG
jgi:hypothetical protein